MPAPPAAAPTASAAAVQEALREHFGFGGLRPGQDDAIRPVLDGKDALVVMPTGAGKSLVYQLAAMLRPGVTLVISPLIALMKDQVDALTRHGVPAVALNSAMPMEEQRAALDAMREGAVKLVYVAPERLQNRGFLAAASRAEVGLLAVDEAHCVSQWGHDFRPDYLHIARARRRIAAGRRVPTVALTATATPRVQDDIVATLEVPDAERVVTGFNRPNLLFEVRATPSAADKRRALKGLLEEMDEAPGAGIIYCGTRKQTEAVTRFVKEKLGRDIRAYHAGLPDRERHEVQDAFISGGLGLVAATNAFGMGVDRADVRLVAHWGIPSDLESYYQEAGRAGRDGEPARAVLLYATHDAALREWFIDQAAPEEKELRTVLRHVERQAGEAGHGEVAAVDPESFAERLDLHPVRARVALSLLRRAGALNRLDDRGQLRQYAVHGWQPEQAERVLDAALRRQRHKRHSLKKMVGYAETDACRRALVLDHFGDPAPPEAARCCDNCLVEAAAPPPPDELPAYDALPMGSRIALGLLDAVRRLRWGVGRLTLVKMFAGSKAQGMDRYAGSPYYGRLGFLNQDDIDKLYKRLITDGYLRITGSDRPVVELTAVGKRALAHREAIPLEVPASSTPGTRSSGSRSSAPADETIDEADVPLFDALKAWRTQTAKEAEVPSYIVFNDRTLAAIARARPRDDDGLLAVSGVGPAKLERYGADVLRLVAEAP